MAGRISRRNFFRNAGAAAIAANVSLMPNRGKAVSVSANETFVLGLMGARIRGSRLAELFAKIPGVHIAYVCDVDEEVAGACAEKVTDLQKPSPQVATDFRRILDDTSVDGLIVAAPDHWHAIATLLACQAGKHVYCEKPVSHNVEEGRQMVNAARKYRRVVQTGTMRRSSESLKAMVDFLQSGGIGRIHFARAWIVSRRPSIGHAVDEAASPAHVDYDMWLGPAPKRRFNRNHFHYNWHWQWEYGTGELGNNGVHGLDLAIWGLGVGQPSAVSSCGGKHFFDDDQVTPDTQIVCYEYPGLTLTWEHRTWSPHPIAGSKFGVEFHGEEGVVTTDGVGWVISRNHQKVESGSELPSKCEPHHQQDWLTCICENRRPAADIEIGHTSAVLCHLGNIAQRLGRKVVWNAAQENFGVPDAEAAALLKREYRDPWALPLIS